MNKLSRVLAGTLCALIIAGCACCASQPKPMPAQPMPPTALMEKALKENPLAAGEGMKVTVLGANDKSSCALVQIREKERLHTHNAHDLKVWLWKGEGVLVVDGKSQDMKQGDQAEIPKGRPHSFTNASGETAVAVVWFTPAFDGKDTQYLE